MFGYVTVNEPELKVKEYQEYKAYYCGLCEVLRRKYGMVGQMTLTYDMTFLIILLTSLYECKPKLEEHRCKSHPAQKQKMLINRYTEYAADMSLLLSYHQCKDDWKDEKSKSSLAGFLALEPAYRKVEKRYPQKSRQMEKELRKLWELEEQGETDIDRVSGCFGKVLETLFVYEEDAWSQTLRRMGFFLGKFIYIMDAFDDVEKDVKKGSYNLFKDRYQDENFTEECRSILNLMMAECTIEFEKLPCLYDAGILRNILYAGVWKKFEKKIKERGGKKKEGMTYV